MMLRVYKLLYALAVCALICLSPALGAQTNPLFNGGDPWVVFDPASSLYYYSASCGAAAICLKSAATPIGLAAAPWITVWNAPLSGPNSTDVWAPELHQIGGKWYIYYAADDNSNNNHHRLFVLQADTADPLKSYSMPATGAPNGQLTESTGHWAIDPDVFTAADGNLYIVWSCTNYSDSTFPQATCLARMTDPLHIAGITSQISTPAEVWETRTQPIQEGPVGFTHSGRTYITYSASASWTDNDYSVGLLSATRLDLLDPRSWTKYGPIFDHHGATYGPGSVVFIQSPDGQEIWNFYHAIDNLTCNPSYNCRDIRMQRMAWTPDGLPLLGYPLNPGVPLNMSLVTAGSAWGPAFGDAAEGHPALGAVVGNWPVSEDGSIQSASLGSGWQQIFSQSNPNLEDYTISLDSKWIESGTSSQFPKYGVYAAYSDSKNYLSAWLDLGNRVLATYGMLNGAAQTWANCALPPSFNPGVFNTLEIRKSGPVFSLSLNGTHLAGACNDRSVDLLNGQAGLVTEDTRAIYRNLRISPSGQAPRRPRN